MRENFETAFPFTIGREGGYSDDARDPGRQTKYGVTITTLSQYLRRPATVDEVKRLTLATAKDIFLRFYWQPAGCDALPAGLDVLVFDVAVNSGIGRAHQFLARATFTPSVVGRIESIHQQRMSFWQRLATWTRFGNGWTAREVACRELALKLAGAAHA